MPDTIVKPITGGAGTAKAVEPGRRISYGKLIDFLSTRTALTDLKTICLRLRDKNILVNYDDLEGTTHREKINALIIYLERHASLQILVDTGRESLPDLMWDNVYEAQPEYIVNPNPAPRIPAAGQEVRNPVRRADRPTPAMVQVSQNLLETLEMHQHCLSAYVKSYMTLQEYAVWKIRDSIEASLQSSTELQKFNFKYWGELRDRLGKIQPLKQDLAALEPAFTEALTQFNQVLKIAQEQVKTIYNQRLTGELLVSAAVELRDTVQTLWEASENLAELCRDKTEETLAEIARCVGALMAKKLSEGATGRGMDVRTKLPAAPSGPGSEGRAEGPVVNPSTGRL
jgi:uncharacterized protein YoxC